jgi:hypothetical protein
MIADPQPIDFTTCKVVSLLVLFFSVASLDGVKAAATQRTFWSTRIGHRLLPLDPGTKRVSNSGPLRIDWRMADRFGLDRHGQPAADRFVLPNTYAYAHPDAFTVQFAAAGTLAADPTAVSFDWTLSGQPFVNLNPNVLGPKRSWSMTGRNATARLPAGNYRVILTMTDQSSRTRSVSESLTVRDLLLVSLGDSFASGEGNPEVPAKPGHRPEWAEGLTPEMTRAHAEAHRSNLAGPARAALEIERRDPHTSVTFISVAHSGARITAPAMDAGSPRDRLAPNDLRAQLVALRQIVGDRPIDALFLSIGGNDVGFGDLARAMPSPLFDRAAWQKQVRGRLANLDGEFRLLRRLIHLSLDVADRHVFLTEYADPTGDRWGHTAAQILGDIFPGIRVDQSKLEWARTEVLGPLNAAVARAAAVHDWNYVGEIAEDFRRHGYAADDPYTAHPEADHIRWIRTYGESTAMQGDISGTLHPNEFGHRAIARRLVTALEQIPFDNGGSPRQGFRVKLIV